MIPISFITNDETSIRSALSGDDPQRTATSWILLDLHYANGSIFNTSYRPGCD